MTLEMVGSASKLVHRPLPADDPRQRQPDISLAREVLGWRPRVELEEGLARTIEHFRELLGRGGAPAPARRHRRNAPAADDADLRAPT